MVTVRGNKHPGDVSQFLKKQLRSPKSFCAPALGIPLVLINLMLASFLSGPSGLPLVSFVTSAPLSSPLCCDVRVFWTRLHQRHDPGVAGPPAQDWATSQPCFCAAVSTSSHELLQQVPLLPPVQSDGESGPASRETGRGHGSGPSPPSDAHRRGEMDWSCQVPGWK